MLGRIVITPEGEIRAFIDEGDFEGAKVRLEALIADLREQGIEIDAVGDVERHRHDDEHDHEHEHDHE